MAETNHFPLGARLSVASLSKDPYPQLLELQHQEPISWIAELNMYYVLRHSDVEYILKDAEHFITGTESSLVYDTFGEHMMTVEGKQHQRYKGKVRKPFMPKFIRENIETEITCLVDSLIDGFQNKGQIELRSAFASRIPVQTMLQLFGLPQQDEKYLRCWYNDFERALANFQWDEAIRSKAKTSVEEFHQHLQQSIGHLREHPNASLLSSLANAPEAERLTDEEIRHNALIIFFGGISTVEALILNALYALSTHADVFERVRKDLSLLPKVLEETVRWAAPVQSATRHVVKDCEYGGVKFKKGDTVNCMLNAANRDPEVFSDANRFDIDRPDLRRHIGFATGGHSCLGSHLARAEARIALERLITRLPNCRMDPGRASAPEGYEFRQPLSLQLIWNH
ncbi:cytochrome P450 [Pseudomaricurvus alkylphenolicus]|jgi:cytochrome P450|uniref:cytochrome P450 n=1 Tax=Pseudomaricurvus alkylphenolicus TaxID=1306991 RepID=UPI001F0CEB26|nr:cytochrome P450 [Pseudomaricurvus alkylphenolicus]NIB41061.1 cytochrome P450 [Pseudomaricurvus alkylphenolicus]